jgi:hypothetical protein
MKLAADRFKISPNFYATKLLGANDTIENRVDVHEDRIRGWLLDWASKLNDVDHGFEHAGFAALQLALAYFEAHAVFLHGEDSVRDPQQFFCDGLLDVFPELVTMPERDRILEILWKDARCGLFHNGIARRRIVLADSSKTFRYLPDEHGEHVVVDRHSLVRRIESHFADYIRRLRQSNDGLDARIAFQAAWEIVHRK